MRQVGSTETWWWLAFAGQAGKRRNLSEGEVCVFGLGCRHLFFPNQLEPVLQVMLENANVLTRNANSNPVHLDLIGVLLDLELYDGFPEENMTGGTDSVPVNFQLS